MKLKLNIPYLVTDTKCYGFLRSIRWVGSLSCPHYQDDIVVKRGKCSYQKRPQKYDCRAYQHGFNDLTGTVFQDSNKSLEV